MNLSPRSKSFGLIKLPYIGAKNHFFNQKTANNWKFPCSDAAEMKKTFTYRLFDKELLDRLNRFRKKLNATVNDVMLACYYQALYKVIQPDAFQKPLCVLNTYDLRLNHLKNHNR